VSLLLEALKKAELAKQAAKEPAQATDTPPFTRDKLPDITQPMEIHSDDLSLAHPEPAPKRAEKPMLELALEQPAVQAAPPAEPAPAMRAASFEPSFAPPDEQLERKQAQQLFEAKELDVNPRKPFYYTVGALGLFALGTIGYFWYQLQPRTAYRVPPPSAQPAPPPAAKPAPAVEPTVAAATTVKPPAGTQPDVPPNGSAKPAAATPVSPPAATAPVAARSGPQFVPKGAPASGPAAAPPPGPARRQSQSNIVITSASVQPDPILDGAYQAFNAGDLAKARSGYQQVLQSRPENRDALLGMAAVEMQAAHYDLVESYFIRLLELDPRDPQAQAGLIGLRGQGDPMAAESRLKSMIATNPEATFLQFTLGNQYAAQSRWEEAQQAYFKAFAGDPEHPDFAYNLAVSLDRLHQAKPALEYYRRALALAQDRPISFDKAQVSKRISQLQP
jgi:tetratricopeptide (TPR) repeat protein